MVFLIQSTKVQLIRLLIFNFDRTSVLHVEWLSYWKTQKSFLRFFIF